MNQDGSAPGPPTTPKRMTLDQALALGVDAHGAGRLADAEHIYRQVLAAEPDNPTALNLLGVLAHQGGDNDTARDLITRAIDIAPDYAEAHNNLCNVLREMGLWEDAVAAGLEATRLGPGDANAHNNLGNAYHELRRLDAAAASYEQALAIEDDPEVRLNLGSAYQQLDRVDDAIACYERVLAAEPGHRDAHYNLGTAFESRGELDAAIGHFERAGTSTARLQALGCLYTAGRHDDMMALLEKCADVDRTDRHVASMSVFLSYQVGRDNPHPFCPNPLDFIRVVKLGDSTEETDALVDAVMAEIDDLPVLREPPRVAINSGYQTMNNLFDEPTGALLRLRDTVNARIDAYHADVGSEKCLFTEMWPKQKRYKAWIVRLFTGGHQEDHIHPGGWLSGVLYLKLPAAPDGDEGCIDFKLDGYDYPLLRDDAPVFRHRPEKGDLILFPATTIHATVPLKTEEERVCLAFNLFPDRDG